MNLVAKQIEAPAQKDNLAIGIFTRGISPKVVSALATSNALGRENNGLSGKDGGDFYSICNVNLLANSNDHSLIQEMHISVDHTK